tara:strand:+ start:1834 stop:2274 length:441 start_codon:yes stop_codon:yes gene_type:complete
MNGKWIFMSLIVMLTTSSALILLKLLNNTKHDIGILLAISYIISAVLGLFYIIYNFKNYKYSINNISFYVIILVILFSVMHICSQQIMSNAIIIAPNISYCHLIINLNVIITLIASYFIFKQNITYKSIIGILIALIGVGIIIFNN